MSRDSERRAIAKRLLENMKLCAGMVDELVADASAIAPGQDAEILKTKAGELLGCLYLDIYRKNILPEFPEFTGSLESGG